MPENLITYFYHFLNKIHRSNNLYPGRIDNIIDNIVLEHKKNQNKCLIIECLSSEYLPMPIIRDVTAALPNLRVLTVAKQRKIAQWPQMSQIMDRTPQKMEQMSRKVVRKSRKVVRRSRKVDRTTQKVGLGPRKVNKKPLNVNRRPRKVNQKWRNVNQKSRKMVRGQRT